MALFKDTHESSFEATDRMSGFPVPEYADVMRVLQAGPEFKDWSLSDLLGKSSDYPVTPEF